MACRSLPPRSAHPLAAILLPHNGLLVGGKKLPMSQDEKRETEMKRWSERGRERWRKLSLAGPPNWVTAVMICRLSSRFPSLLFHFLFPPPSLSPSGLREVFIFLMSRWFFLFFFFCSYLIRSGWKAIFVILSSWRLHLYVRTMVELSGVKCLCGDFGRRWWKKWTQGSE